MMHKMSNNLTFDITCQIIIYSSDVIKSGCIHPFFWRKDWDEHFGDADHETYSNHTRSGLLEVTNQSSFYVSSCSFIDQTNRAIYFNNNGDSTFLLIEITTFDNCTCSNSGGSLYFFNKGQIIQERICYYKSKASKGSHAFYSEVSIATNSEKPKNFFKSSSIFECGDIENYWTLYLIKGKVEYENINNTFSKAKSHAAYFIKNYIPDSFVKFSNFDNLTQTSRDINAALQSENNGDASHVISSNFIKNGGNFLILIHAVATSMTIENCSIFGNTCESTFGAYKCTVTVKQCYFDSDTTFKEQSEILFSSNSSSKFTNSFNETIAFCSLRVKQLEETVLVRHLFIDATCIAIPCICQISNY